MKQNVLYVISDNHINRSKFDSEKGVFTQKNLKNVLETIKKDLDKNKKNFLLFGGDTFDKFDSTNDFRKWELWFAETLTTTFVETNIEILMITGNHDCNNVSSYTALSGFNKYKSDLGVKFVLEEQGLSNYESNWLNFTLASFPFLHNNRVKGKYLEILNEQKKKNILLSHFIIDGTPASNHEGFSYRNVHSTHEEVENLWYDLVLLWDNHTHYKRNNIISIGSSEQVSFAEEWEQKFILKISFEENNKDYNMEKILIEEASNQKITLVLDFTKNIEELKKIIENEIKEKHCEGSKDVRVKIKISYEHQDKISLIRKILKEIKEKTVSYQEEIEITDKTSIQDLDEIELSELLNEDNLVSQYSKKIFQTNDEKFHQEILKRKDGIIWKKEIVLEKIYSKMNKKEVEKAPF